MELLHCARYRINKINEGFLRDCSNKIVAACSEIPLSKEVRIPIPYRSTGAVEYLLQELPGLKLTKGLVRVDPTGSPYDTDGVIIPLDQFLNFDESEGTGLKQ